jgi:hypothetical protein
MHFCPGSREIHLVSHPKKVNTTGMPEVGGRGFHTTGA